MSAAKFIKIPLCETNHSVDVNSLDHWRCEVLNINRAQQMAEFFRLLGDPDRLRILSLLAKGD